jgi:energy-coupling factor transporter ATP-binding protein EcfA2
MVLSKHDGASYQDFNSPIYIDLEKAIPSVSWKSADTDSPDGFRLYFRDAQEPWSSTGVVEFDAPTGTIKITPLGKLLASSRVTPIEVFTQTMLSYQEGGDAPFRILAAAFLDPIANNGLSLNELMRGVMQNYRPGIDRLSDALKTADPSVNFTPTETRRFRHLLTLMTSAGAISSSKDGRFVAWDVALLKKLDRPTGASGAISLSKLVTDFYADTKSINLSLENKIILRFSSSLLTKRFLIFTGLSGSGKTKLAQAFARWITPDPKYLNPDDPSKVKNPNPCVALVAVGADWTGNEHILGYPHGLDDKKYVTKQTLDLIIHASNEENKNTPHFLILDEMNLSHVERYFADLLSAIESDENIRLHFDDARTEGAIPKEIKLPPNLFIIGTVNVDETTYMFSPKVLDRANVIEFRMDEGELEKFLVTPDKPNLENLDGEGASFGAAFVAAASSPTAVPADVETAYRAEMLLFFKVLQAYGCEYGYRVAHEAARFMKFYKELGNHPNDGSWFASAFDALIVQKFLPKLNGSEAKLRGILWSLAYLCSTSRPWLKVDAKDREAEILKWANEAIAKAKAQKQEGSPSKILELNFSNDPMKAPYPLSFEKVVRMWEAVQLNGFTSFAEN